MDTYSAELTQSAVSDIREIYGYIKLQLLEPETATRQRDHIKSGILNLSSLPNRHALISDGYLREQGIRFFPVDNYLVFYVVHEAERKVIVLRVLYSRRDWQVVLSDDSSLL